MNKVFYNGKIHTMSEKMPIAQALLVRDGRFEAVGSDEEIIALSQEAERHDLNGAAVYPGMIDSHLHILNHAMASMELEMNGVRHRAEALSMIAERAKELEEGSYIEIRGFNEDLWDDRRLITRRELDIVAPRHAVRMTRICGHMVIANTMAMDKAGVTAQTEAPDGGAMDYETGFFAENAIGLIYPESGDTGVEDCKRLLERGMNLAADAGLTTIYSDDFGTGGFSMHTVAAAYRALEQEGKMPVRVVQQCALPGDEAWEEFLKAGFAYHQGSDMYRIGPRKLYADGSLGARTAWLSVPYADMPERKGVPIYKQEELNRLAAQSHKGGMPFIVHAIGDGASDSVIQAIEYARREVPGTDDLPDGIVHCQITTPEILEKIGREHVYVYAQPVFVEYDLHICRDRVGETLEKSSYNWKTILESGACISAGSDCPVEPLDPAHNIYCAVTRKDFDGEPKEGWLREQCLTVEEAVGCHTVQAAKAAGLDKKLGRIEAGYLADMTVYPVELDVIDADDILNLKPIMTVVGGAVRKCPE